MYLYVYVCTNVPLYVYIYICICVSALVGPWLARPGDEEGPPTLLRLGLATVTEHLLATYLAMFRITVTWM